MTSKNTPLRESLAVLQRDSDAETNIPERWDNTGKTQMFRIARFVAILMQAEASIAVMTRIAGRIYMAPHLNST